MTQLLIDPRTGEIVHTDDIVELRKELARREDVIAGLQRDIRGWAQRYRELERDRDVEAREHDLWPVGESIFRDWRKRCRHPRCVWTADRFWLIEPFLSNGKYGKQLDDRIALCRRAVAGAEFDAFEVKRKNGSTKRFDEWDRIFGSAGQVEEFCNRAPIGWQP